MKEAGLIWAFLVKRDRGDVTKAGGQRLTWHGHDRLDAIRVTTSFTLVRNEAGSRAPCNSASMNTFLLWPWRLVYCLRPP